MGKLLFALAAGILGTGSAGAGVTQVTLRFDDLPRLQRVGEQYAALGVHFSQTEFAVMGGLDEGDPGNWDLRGTNGSAFVGFNGQSPNPYTWDVTFDSLVTGVSFDAARANGSNSNFFAGVDVQYWRGGLQVHAESLGFGAINIWTTASYPGAVDRVTLQGTGPSQSFRPFGVDNFSFTVPTPGTAAALATWTVLCARRHRRGS